MKITMGYPKGLRQEAVTSTQRADFGHESAPPAMVNHCLHFEATL